MARSKTSFSHSIQNEIEQLRDERLLPVFLIMFAFWIVCAVEWTQRFAGSIPDPRFWTFLALVVTVYGGLQVFRLHRAPVKKPDSAERRIARLLERLRSRGFIAFHNVPGPGRLIDHVVVGPSGVYAIESKARSGSGTIDYRGDNELIFGGRIKDSCPLREARDAAGVVETELRELAEICGVQPLVIFLGNWSIATAGEFTVDVITAAQLEEYFDNQRPRLSGREISRISEQLAGIGRN